ncbi:MAG: hypothetical protein CVU89_08715 [Firmicutes bacterium HGW-Firmicutes-14]|nr:MAG: hypothetical protein CVU89_08715 [Firmicutes bacterium HGW-Firmicutes-14]
MHEDTLRGEAVERAIESVNAPEEREYIENNIMRFFHILRHLGVRISSSETVDAVNALSSIDMLDRLQVETALLATLAKSPEDRVILDRAFEAFFATPEKRAERAEKHRAAREEEAREMQAAEQELKYELEGPGEGETREVSIPLTEEEKKVYCKLPEETKKNLQKYLKKQFQSNPVNNPEDLIASMVRSSLNYWKYYLKQKGDGPPEVDFTGDEEIDGVLQEVVDRLKDEENIFYQDIQKITETDMPTAAALITKLSRKLATRIARRYRHSKKKQRLDLRRTIRHNIRYGGTMFNLQYRTRKVQKPRILLICDVSGSMARYAAFVLQFMYGLSSVIEGIESFIFSEGVERVTGEFGQNRPFETAMADIINRSEDWGRGTDLKRALDVITRDYGRLITGDTFVIIVSDTKTLHSEKAAAILKNMRRKVKDILWLNTLPGRLWNDTGTVSLFKRHSRMFECNTLAHLDKIMRTQMLK